MKIETTAYNTIEKALRDYNWYDETIVNIEFSLRNPYTEKDDNIGGGKSDHGNSTENGAIAMADMINSDALIKNIRWNKMVINSAFARTDNDTREIINYLYCDIDNLTSTELAIKLSVSVRTIERKRTKFFEMLVNKLWSLDI